MQDRLGYHQTFSEFFNFYFFPEANREAIGFFLFCL